MSPIRAALAWAFMGLLIFGAMLFLVRYGCAPAKAGIYIPYPVRWCEARLEPLTFIAVDRFPQKKHRDYTRWESERRSRAQADKMMRIINLTSLLFDGDDWLIVRAPDNDYIERLNEPGDFAAWDESWYSPEDAGYRLYFALREGGSFGDTLSVVAARSRQLEIPIWRGGKRPALVGDVEMVKEDDR